MIVGAEWPAFLRYPLASATMSGLVFGAFEALERFTPDDLRQQIADRIRGTHRSPIVLPRASPPADAQKDTKRLALFSSLLDGFFGHQHLSWRCFLRSALVSVATVTVLAAFVFLWGKMPGPMTDSPETAILTFGAFAIPLNVLADYLSLLESRVILRRAAATSSSILVLMWLVVDVVLTAGIITVWMAVVAAFIPPYWSVTYLLDVFLTIPVEAYEFARWENPIGAVPFYSTFSTSVWVWLYVAAFFMLRAMSWFKGCGRLLARLDVDNQPVRIIGGVASLGTFVLFLGLCIAFWD